jgi:hypothetical protein
MPSTNLGRILASLQPLNEGATVDHVPLPRGIGRVLGLKPLGIVEATEDALALTPS